jgi:hypothetical protein
MDYKSRLYNSSRADPGGGAPGSYALIFAKIFEIGREIWTPL